VDRIKKLVVSPELVEAVKEGLRVMALAMVPMLISSLEAGKTDWKIIVIGGIIAGLRFIDKFLHEIGKSNGKSVLLTGITRF